MNFFARLRYLHRARKARRRGERNEIQAILELVKPGDTALDIGAHKGSYLYWLREAVGESGRVFAFEPQPALATYLRDVVTTFRWTNVTVKNMGVSIAPATLELNVPGATGAISPGASFESTVADRAECHTVRIDVTSLDALYRSAEVPQFIKCDVEGHELKVFQGGEKLLRRAHPALLFECEARHLGKTPLREVFDTLTGWGYAGQFFTKDGLLPIAEFRQENHQSQSGPRFWDQPGYCNNFLFTAAPHA